MSRLPEEHLLLAAALAAEKARDFFQLDPKWDIHVEVTNLDDGHMGAALVRPEYYAATVEISSRLESLEQAWSTAAHEVAHVALAHWHEYADVADLHGQEHFPPTFRIPLEKTTVLLEKLFLQHHPYSDQLAPSLVDG